MVPTLYEEWKMNQKYSGLSRASVRLSQGGDVDGPPPFEKLQVGAPRKFSQKEKSSCQYFFSMHLYSCITRIPLILLAVTVVSYTLLFLLSSFIMLSLEWHILGLVCLVNCKGY